MRAESSVISFLSDLDGNLILQKPRIRSFFSSSAEKKNSLPDEALYAFSLRTILFDTLFCLGSRQRMHLHFIFFFSMSCSIYCLRFVLSTPASVTNVGMSLWTRIILTCSGTVFLNSEIISAALAVDNG